LLGAKEKPALRVEHEFYKSVYKIRFYTPMTNYCM
jgi:hypothetical protein